MIQLMILFLNQKIPLGIKKVKLMIPIHLTVVMMLADFASFIDLYKILELVRAFISQNLQMPSLLLIDLVIYSPGIPHDYVGLSQK